MSENEKHRPNLPDTADHVGQAAGGITGVVAGAMIGASAGPIGVVLGGVAGAIGGWWSGRAIAEAAEDITEADEQYYRADFERRSEPRGYDEIRQAYYLGHVAAAHPDYQSFEEIEPELERGWTGATQTSGEWKAVRDYASVGFYRGRERRKRPR